MHSLLEFYEQMVQLAQENRGTGVSRIMIGTYCVVDLNKAETVEQLLRSNTLIDKSADYEVLHRWLGLGLLTRYCSG